MYGNDAVLLTSEERAALPAGRKEHTHRWTVALRSAASPEPSSSSTSKPTQGESADQKQPQSPQQPARFGGADDYSYFIKKVQFKLHETIPNSLRTLDKPPWQVTETGWGEFDLSIKIFFVSEAYEKPMAFVHRLKLHPWAPALAASNLEEPPPPFSLPVAPAPAGSPSTAEPTPAAQSTTEQEDGDTTMEDPTAAVKAEVASPAPPGDTSQQGGDPAPTPPPQILSPVYSWQYDEIVFTEPAESLFRLLTQHPPTPLPSQPRFETDTISHPSGNAYELSGLVQEKEGKRLEKARKDVLTELEGWRIRLTKAQQKKEALSATSAAATAPEAPSEPMPQAKEESVQP